MRQATWVEHLDVLGATGWGVGGSVCRVFVAVGRRLVQTGTRSTEFTGTPDRGRLRRDRRSIPRIPIFHSHHFPGGTLMLQFSFAWVRTAILAAAAAATLISAPMGLAAGAPTQAMAQTVHQ